MNDLKAKFQEWEEWLIGDDPHSIIKQISSMVWDSAVFQSIIECRKNAPKNEQDEIELNGVVHRFIDKCFFETQALAIRRLLDKNVARGKFSVISLYRLVDDIEKQSKLLTRRNILEAHDPCDYEQEKRRLSDEAPPGFGVGGYEDNKYYISEVTHKFIDSLAGKDSSNRSLDDCVRPQIFKWLRQRLSYCDEISKFVDKFLAHSATPESRKHLKPNELDVTLGRILEAHEIICQTAIVIGGRMGILSEGQGFPKVLPIPQYDQFKYFDKAWASEETIKKLSAFWRTYDRKTRSWHQWEWENEFNKFL